MLNLDFTNLECYINDIKYEDLTTSILEKTLAQSDTRQKLLSLLYLGYKLEYLYALLCIEHYSNYELFSISKIEKLPVIDWKVINLKSKEVYQSNNDVLYPGSLYHYLICKFNNFPCYSKAAKKVFYTNYPSIKFFNKSYKTKAITSYEIYYKKEISYIEVPVKLIDNLINTTLGHFYVLNDRYLHFRLSLLQQNYFSLSSLSNILEINPILNQKKYTTLYDKNGQNIRYSFIGCEINDK